MEAGDVEKPHFIAWSEYGTLTGQAVPSLGGRWSLREFGKPSVAYSPRLGVEKDQLFRPTRAVPGLRKKALSR